MAEGQGTTHSESQCSCCCSEVSVGLVWGWSWLRPIARNSEVTEPEVDCWLRTNSS